MRARANARHDGRYELLVSMLTASTGTVDASMAPADW